MDASREHQIMCMLDLLAQDIGFVSYRKGSPFFKTQDGLLDLPSVDDFRFNILCSDTFAWACADSEEFTLAEAPEVHRLYRTGGYKAVAEWVQTKRGGPEKAPFVCAF